MYMRLEGTVDHVEPAVRSSRLSRQDLMNLGSEWQSLVDNALEDNAYYSPRYARALLSCLDPHRDVNALAVRKGSRLIGLLPFVPERWRWAGLAEVNTAWVTDYSFSSIPLIDRAHVGEAVDAFLAGMAGDLLPSKFWLLPACNVDGPVAKALRQGLNDRQLPSVALNPFDRPVLDTGASFADHMNDHVSAKRRRELRRSRKRLSELGDLCFRSFTSGAGLDRAVDDFLRIERAGWKGRRGTALGCTESGREFMHATFCSGGRGQIGRADALYLNDSAIAVSLAIQVGRTAFTIKCAFDEQYRREGAGLLLEEDIIRDVLTNRWADRLDSATQPGHVIQSLWNASVRVGDLLFCSSDRSMPAFQRCVAYERSRAALRNTARQASRGLRETALHIAGKARGVAQASAPTVQAHEL